MKINIENIKKIATLTTLRKLDWYRFEHVSCVNADYEDGGFVLCKYYDDFENQIIVSLTRTDDWGNIKEECRFKETAGESFAILSDLYDKVDKIARVEES